MKVIIRRKNFYANYWIYLVARILGTYVYIIIIKLYKVLKYSLFDLLTSYLNTKDV